MLAAAVLTAVPVMAGCGPGTVEKDELAETIGRRLEQKVGQRPDEVTCPRELPAEVGASVKCELTAGGTALDVTTSVTSVDGGDVKFDIEVEELPAGR